MKKYFNIIITASMFFFCSCATKNANEDNTTKITHPQWEIAIGYGLLDKNIEVLVEGKLEVNIKVNQQMERHAQLLGPSIIKKLDRNNAVLVVEIIIDGKSEHKSNIKLSDGHIIIINRQNDRLFLEQAKQIFYL